MSREIKFRAWDGEKFHHQENQYLTSFLRRFITSVNYEKGIISEHESYLDSHLDDYLQQYTGLEDKSGTEVYEGDIVVAQTVERSPLLPDYVSGYLKGVIVYYDNSFCILNDGTYNPHWTNAAEFEIIGNIYENKDML